MFFLVWGWVNSTTEGSNTSLLVATKHSSAVKSSNCDMGSDQEYKVEGSRSTGALGPAPPVPVPVPTPIVPKYVLHGGRTPSSKFTYHCEGRIQ